MIKGVNKYVVEIVDTENPVFEKIICYVKSEYAGAGSAALEKRAGEAVSGLTAIREAKEEKKKRKKVIPRWAVSIGSAAIGAGLCLLIK